MGFSPSVVGILWELSVSIAYPGNWLGHSQEFIVEMVCFGMQMNDFDMASPEEMENAGRFPKTGREFAAGWGDSNRLAEALILST